MILYFPATGNCKYVAQRLAAARKCPVQAIRMENGRPVWVQEA